MAIPYMDEKGGNSELKHAKGRECIIETIDKVVHYIIVFS